MWIYCLECVQNPFISEMESARSSGKIAERSSSQQQIQTAWDDDSDKHRYHLAGWFRGHIGIESNILSSAFSRSGYDALLSRMNLHFRSRVWMRMSYELIPTEASWPMNRMRWFPTLRWIERENASTQDAPVSMNESKRTLSSFRTDMGGYHFLTSFGYFNRKQTEECGRFGAETEG